MSQLKPDIIMSQYKSGKNGVNRPKINKDGNNVHLFSNSFA